MSAKHECRFLKIPEYSSAPCYGCKYTKVCKDAILPEKSIGHIGFSSNNEYFEYKNGIYRAAITEPVDINCGVRRVYGQMRGRSVWLCSSGTPAHRKVMEWVQ